MNISALRTNLVTPLLVGLAVIGAILGGWAIPLRGLDTLVWLALAVAFIVVFAYPRAGLYAMLFLTPLVAFIDVGGDSTVVRYAGIVTFVAWGASKVVKREPIRPLLTGPLATPMLAFVSICVFSGLWSDFTSWRITTFSYVQLVIWVLMMFDLIDSPRRLETALVFVLGGALVSAGIVNYNSINSSATVYLWERSMGGRGDANFSASTYLMVLPYTFLLMRRRKWEQQLVGFASFGFLLLAIGFTVSRTGLLLILVMLIGQFLLLSKQESRIKYLLIVAFVVLAIAPLVPWQRIDYRFSRAWSVETGPDLRLRIQLVQDAWQTFIEHPILGHGLGAGGNRYSYLHNAFLQVLAELGLPGFLSMVWIWVTAWQSLSKAQRHARNLQTPEMDSLLPMIRLTVFIYLLFSLAVSNMHTREFWFVLALTEICYWIAFVLSTAGKREPWPIETKGSPEPSVNWERRLPVGGSCRMNRTSIKDLLN